jgi:hypothetical protein
MHDLTSVKREIIAECSDDYVGLWSIIRKIAAAGITGEPIVMEATLQLLLQLLLSEKLVAGQFHSEKFEIWDGYPQDIILRIKNEWIALGRSPNIGEIAWFTRGGNAASSI